MSTQPGVRKPEASPGVPPIDQRAGIRRRALLALLPAILGVSLAGCGRDLSPDEATRSVDGSQQKPVGPGPGIEPSPSATAPTGTDQAQPTASVQSPPATPTQTALDIVLSRPVTLRYLDRRWIVTPEELGLGEATAQSAGAQNGLALDEAKLSAFMVTLAKEFDRVAVEARLSIGSDLAVGVSPSKPGVRLDVGKSAEKVRATLLASLAAETLPEEMEVELAADVVPPRTIESDLASAQHSLEKALAGTLTLRVGDRTWRLSPREVAQALSVSSVIDSGQTWQVVVADEPFKGILEKAAPEVAQSPQDARLDWNGGKLKVIRESKEGRQLDVEKSLARVKAGLVEAGLGDERVIELVTAPVPPAVDHRKKDQLGIKELVESATTSYTTAVPEKKYNINLAASRLNGVVVPPGGTFSFNKEVGPTTLKAGFRWGYGIQRTGSGITTIPSVGGGICQVATTLFQAVFWAGYQVESRRGHSYWIPAYTSRGIVGLDTTVDEASGLDFQFTNTTPNFLLVRARTEGSTVIFSLYGKKPGWKVEVGKAAVTRRVPALSERNVEENPNLEYGKQIQVQAAREGFDVSVVRRVHEGKHVGTAEGGPGKLRTLQVKSRYVPTGTVIAVGTKGRPSGAR